MKSNYTEHSFGGRARPRTPSFAGAPVTKWLLIVLAVLFLLDVSGRGSDSLGYISPYAALDGSVLVQIWRWITYPMINLNVGEWLFSMIVLFSFGKLLEPALGSRRYAVLLGFTTLAGALVYAVMSAVTVSQLPLSGASGLAIVILVATALLYPEQKVQLMIPPVPLKLKNLVIGLVGIMVVMAIPQRADPANTLAQLSAIGVSFFCLKNKHWLDLRGNKSAKKSTPSKSKRAKKLVGMKPRTILNLKDSKREAEINEILDKVSAEGIGALTEDERELLKFSSKK